MDFADLISVAADLIPGALDLLSLPSQAKKAEGEAASAIRQAYENSPEARRLRQLEQVTPKSAEPPVKSA